MDKGWLGTEVIETGGEPWGVPESLVKAKGESFRKKKRKGGLKGKKKKEVQRKEENGEGERKKKGKKVAI